MATKLRKAKRAAPVRRAARKDFAIIEQIVGAPSPRHRKGQAETQSQAESRAAQAEFRGQPPLNPERSKAGCALTPNTATSAWPAATNGLGGGPCHQDDPALRSCRGVEAALSRRRISR